MNDVDLRIVAAKHLCTALSNLYVARRRSDVLYLGGSTATHAYTLAVAVT